LKNFATHLISKLSPPEKEKAISPGLVNRKKGFVRADDGRNPEKEPTHNRNRLTIDDRLSYPRQRAMLWLNFSKERLGFKYYGG